MMRMRSFCPSPTRLRRGGTVSTLIILCLVGIAVVLFFSRIQIEENKVDARAQLHAAQADPQQCLTQFFIERSAYAPDSPAALEPLLDFMSQEDRAWFERNLAWLGARAGTIVSRSDQEQPSEESRVQALQRLLHFGGEASRPIIAQVQLAASGELAVAYIHEPGRLETLREVFLIKESGGLWKIRRFLGERDSAALMNQLIEQKRAADTQLDADEQLFTTLGAGYPAHKRQELLAEAGVPAAGPKP